MLREQVENTAGAFHAEFDNLTSREEIASPPNFNKSEQEVKRLCIELKRTPQPDMSNRIETP